MPATSPPRRDRSSRVTTSDDAIGQRSGAAHRGTVSRVADGDTHGKLWMSIMTRNEELFARAQRTIPAGVNSPVRAFRSVGGTPRFFTRGEGPYLWGADGKRYIDYVGSWGPASLGHAQPETVRAVQETARHGLSFGAPTELEIEMAETLCRLLPSMEMVRLVFSGHRGA